MSSECVHCIGLRLPKNHSFGANFALGAPVPTPFYRRGPNSVCYGRPMVYTYVPNFASIGLFCRPLLAKNPNFLPFLDSAFSVVVNFQQSEKVEHGCTTTKFPLSNGIKIVSVLQRLHGEIGRTISDVKSVTNKQTDRQRKNSTFLAAPAASEIRAPSPRARSCTSETFGCLSHSFTARGR